MTPSYFFTKAGFLKIKNLTQTVNPIRQKKYYPKSIKEKPRRISVVFDFNDASPEDLLHDEIYKAINNDMPQLAAAGIRSLVDRFAVSIVKQNKNFTNNIDSLCNLGHITRHQADILETVLDVGHSVVHRSNVPKMNEVELCLKISESIMDIVREFPVVAERIKNKTPQRSKLNKRQKIQRISKEVHR